MVIIKIKIKEIYNVSCQTKFEKKDQVSRVTIYTGISERQKNDSKHVKFNNMMHKLKIERLISSSGNNTLTI